MHHQFHLAGEVKEKKVAGAEKSTDLDIYLHKSSERLIIKLLVKYGKNIIMDFY